MATTNKAKHCECGVCNNTVTKGARCKDCTPVSAPHGKLVRGMCARDYIRNRKNELAKLNAKGAAPKRAAKGTKAATKSVGRKVATARRRAA